MHGFQYVAEIIAMTSDLMIMVAEDEMNVTAQPFKESVDDIHGLV